MSDEVQITRTVSVETQPPAPAPAAKFFLAQKRFWALALGIALNVTMLVLVDGMTLKAAFADEKTTVMVGLILALIVQAGGYASTFSGSKPTAMTPKAARESTTPTPPKVTASVSTTTTPSEGAEQ